jgi:hypothetical protein
MSAIVPPAPTRYANGDGVALPGRPEEHHGPGDILRAGEMTARGLGRQHVSNLLGDVLQIVLGRGEPGHDHVHEDPG